MHLMRSEMQEMQNTAGAIYLNITYTLAWVLQLQTHGLPWNQGNSQFNSAFRSKDQNPIGEFGLLR